MRRIVFIFLISQCFYNFCVGELSFEKKDKYLTAFVDYLNNLPDQPYTYDDGTLLKASETDTNNVWNIEARVKATELDTFKFLKCTGTVRETGEGDVSVDRGYQCQDDPKATAVPVVDIEELVTEGLRRRPVKLENEVESGTTATSGEQFIAVPRHRPSAPCIGCSDFVNPEAEGVPALAALGILQLDFYQPSIAHSLKKVLSVERQVQAVNGVRYILTLLVDYNSCPAGETTGCTDTKTCKVSILEKPWVKLSDGSKYRTVVANNCTGDWIFRDGEQFNGNISNDDRDKADDGPRPTPDYEKIPNTGSIDDNIKVVHSPDVQAQPGLEKMLTEEEIKNIEDQIVPNSEFTLPALVTARPEAADDYSPDQQQEQHVQTEHFFGESAASAPQPSDFGASNSIPEDKKKAIDDLINFFEFASFDPKVDFKDTTRTKRSYKDDIKAFNLAEKFSKMKKSIENAKHLYILAQIMVDYLNEIDLEVKNRVLKNVLAAEEESDTNQHFYYVQARVVIPCQKAKCDGDENLNKICSSVIDSTNERTPQVLSVFCYNEQKPNSKVGKINQIPHDDAVLKTLTTAALKKIESELPDVNALKIIKLVGANTQKVSGILTRIAFLVGFTNCSKTEPFHKRINCTVLDSMGSKMCNVEVLERKWIKTKKISYVCTDRPVSESFTDSKRPYGKTNDRSVQEIVQEALQYLEVQSSRNNKQKLVEIKSVSTQLVAGLLTNVEFSVGYTSCANDADIDVESCEVIASEPLRICQAQIWQRPWLEDGRQMNVTCDNAVTPKKSQAIQDESDVQLRKKRSIGTENPKRFITGGPTEQDPRNPVYLDLAKESWQKYLQVSGSSQPHVVTSVEKVTTQVVSGSLTKIDFTSTAPKSDVIRCHSEVWEQSWLNKKEITVNCQIDDKNVRDKREVVPGGEFEQNPNEPRYRALADESLQKYKQTSGSAQSHVVTTVEKVLTQVVSGSLTKIDFTATAPNSEVIRCHSDVWEQPWLNKKEITVNCQIDDKNVRDKRGIPGGNVEKNPNDPHYRALAEESLQKYKQTTGSSQAHVVTTVEKVTTQVVSGSLTKIDFIATAPNSDVIRCHSEVWEQSWLNKKEITVNCQIDNKNVRDKREVVPGGEFEQNPNEPRYRALAEESLQKYKQTTGSAKSHIVTTVEKVLTQVVSGSLTKIDFTATAPNSDVIRCHSEVWEQSWLNKKEITVNCQIDNNNVRVKRQITGGQQNEDPNDPHYRELAEKSLQKYKQTAGGAQSHAVTSVDSVTTQVVSGTLTRINFTATATTSDVILCYSEIWEQPWLNKTEIDVNCKINDNTSVKKRSAYYIEKYDNSDQNASSKKQDDNLDANEGMTGELVTQNPDSPENKKLAEQCLTAFLKYKKSSQHHKVIQIDKVTTQVVAGVVTRLAFLVSPTDCQIGSDGRPSADICTVLDPDDIQRCTAKVWDKPWKKKKVITVNCRPRRDKREILGYRFKKHNGRLVAKVGSFVEQNASRADFRQLADESLRKYQRLQATDVRHKVIDVKRVFTKVVSGTIYKIDYTATPIKCQMNGVACARPDDNSILYCHAEIWDRPWLHRKNIDVTCNIYDTEENYEEHGEERIKRGLLGGAIAQDVTAERYHEMAEIATKKFQQSIHSKYRHKVMKIYNVFEQVIDGFFVTIEFTISPTTCLIKDDIKDISKCSILEDPKVTLLCSAEIQERLALDFDEDVRVNCKRRNGSKKVPQSGKLRLKRDVGVREKRQNRVDDDDFIDDDTKFYYADRAIKYINDHSGSQNIQKLVTVHSTQSSMAMKTQIVRMYIETAYTFCLRDERDKDIKECDELDGMGHRLCLVKIFPSADDELVINRIKVVCEDDQDFARVTGLSIPDLVAFSIKELERSPKLKYKLVHQGEPNVGPSLDQNVPVKVHFITVSTNCSKTVDLSKEDVKCVVDETRPAKSCLSYIWLIPDARVITQCIVQCKEPKRFKREIPDNPALRTTDDLLIQKFVQESLEKLEMSSLHRYKQRVLQINSYSAKITSGKVTTIDFDVGYTNCLKYEWIDNITKCEFLEHLPRRHCVSQVWERLWLKNGRSIDVNCEDDETPLESRIEFESAETAMQLARQAVRHIEAKYPHPKKQDVVRIFSLEKQLVAGIHFRMKIEVGFTNCSALSTQRNCHFESDGGLNRFCRVNVWIRPWTDHPPNFRVSCDYQDGVTTELYHQVQAEQLFSDFLATYSPEYINDHVEMEKRFGIFRDNVRKIHELNTHEMGTATYAVTRFADLTVDEFRSKYMGLKPSLRDSNQVPMRQAKIPNISIPDKFDWRSYGAVTGVKDQGSCGSCWAFSVTGNIEGQWKLHSGELVPLSEQELVDCDKLDQGCNGGLPDNAYRSIEQMGGLETESDYPYEGEDDKCAFNKTLSRVQISGAVNISSNETDMAKWLVHNGPISIGINANAMQFYVGGVSHPWRMLCSPKNLDHGVLIVGYGVKDYPLFHKRLPYWIVKNSWGAQWGEQGYYRVFRGDGTCGLNLMASSAVI